MFDAPQSSKPVTPYVRQHVDLCIAPCAQAGRDYFFFGYMNNSTLLLDVIVFDDPQSYNPCQPDVRRLGVVKYCVRPFG